MPNNNDIINALSQGGSGMGMGNGGGIPQRAPQGLPEASNDGGMENSINQFLVSLPMPIKQAIIVALKNSENSPEGQSGGQMPGPGMGGGGMPPMM